MSASENEMLVRASIVDELSGPLEVIDAQVKELTKSLVELDIAGAKGAGVRGAGGLAAAQKQAAGLRKELGAAHGVLLNMSRSLVGTFVGALKTGVLGVTGLAAAMTFMGVKATKTLESARLGIQTFVGDAVRGNQLFAQLRTLGGPFNITDLTDAAQSLLTASDGVDHLIPRMKALADIAATQVDPKAALGSLADAINKIQESGVVDARVLRPLLGAGVPVYELLAGELGIPVADVKKTLASGAPIGLPVKFLTDIETEAGPLAKFKGALDKQRQTLAGQFQGIGRAARGALGDVFAPLGDSLKAITPVISAGLVSLIKGVGPQVVTFLTQVAALVGSLLPILQPIASALLGALGQVLAALVPALNQLAPQMPALAAALAGVLIALIPLLPPLTNLTVALVPVLVLGITDLTGVLTTLIRWATPIIDWLARTIDHSTTLKRVLEGLLFVLLGYAALAKVVAVIKGIATAIVAVRDATVALKAAQSGMDVLRILSGAGKGAAAGSAAGAATGAVEGATGAGILAVTVVGIATLAAAAIAAALGLVIAQGILDTQGRKNLSTGQKALGVPDKGPVGNTIDIIGHKAFGWVPGFGPWLDDKSGYTVSMDAARKVKAGTMPAAPVGKKPWWQQVLDERAAKAAKPQNVEGGGVIVQGPLVHADNLHSTADVGGAFGAAFAKVEQQKRERGH